MITGVQDITYPVRDMKRALQFYTVALRMRMIYLDEHWASLKIGELQVGLRLNEGGAVPRLRLHHEGQDAPGDEQGATLTLRSSDIPEDRALIQKQGGKILSESDQAWGHFLVFEDPEGNVLKLMNPK